MPRELRKSFVEHPGANLFLTISLARVFQQPQDFSPIDASAEFVFPIRPQFIRANDGYRLLIRSTPATGPLPRNCADQLIAYLMNDFLSDLVFEDLNVTC
jgi:hypothetical protein